MGGCGHGDRSARSRVEADLESEIGAGIDSVVCPSCGTDVEIKEALTQSIRARLQAEYQSRAKESGRRLKEKEKVLHARDRALADLEAVMARARGDIPLEELLPPHLCDTVQGAENVSWDGKSYEC